MENFSIGNWTVSQVVPDRYCTNYYALLSGFAIYILAISMIILLISLYNKRHPEKKAGHILVILELGKEIMVIALLLVLVYFGVSS